MNIIMPIVVTLTIILITYFLFIWPVFLLLTEYLRHLLKKRLKKRIKGSILASSLSWEKLTIFWKDIPDLRQSDVTNVLRSLLKESYSGEVEELKAREELLESYVKKSEEQDPLSDLPNDVRESIEILLRNPALTIDQMQPLIVNFRKMVSTYERDSLIKSIFNIIGFIATIGSLIFGIYAYNNPKQTRIDNGTKESACVRY